MNLILFHPDEIPSDGRITLTDERAVHMRQVLKSKRGSRVRIGLLNGPVGEGLVESVRKNAVNLQIMFEDAVPPKPKLDLILAMPRPKVMKRLWAQLSALGVGRIVLLRAEKVERFYFDSHVVEPACYEQLLIEGLQQARCTHVPQVFIRPLFKPFIEDELDSLFADHLKMLADPSGTKRVDDIIQQSHADRAVLAVGPEGGWSAYELECLQQRGFNLFSFGRRILRTDTATIGVISMLADRMNRR